MSHLLNDMLLESLLMNCDGFAVIAFVSSNSIPSDHFRPEFEALSESMRKKAKFARIDCEENPSIVDFLKVQATPTTILYKGGEEVARWEGPYSRLALEERLRKEMKA